MKYYVIIVYLINICYIMCIKYRYYIAFRNILYFGVEWMDFYDGGYGCL